ncbi:MAG: transcription-repair coupling factor [Dehalococcoidia bacterium]
MDLSELLPGIARSPSLARLAGAVDAGDSLLVGVPDAAKAIAIATLARRRDAPLLVVVQREDRAEALAEELVAWLGDPDIVTHFPQRDAVPYERLAPDPEAVRQRIQALARLSAGEPSLVVASAMALAQRTLAPGELPDADLTLRAGASLNPDTFLARLTALGYAVEPLVDSPGQVSRRGGIIDVFPSQAERPVRIELVGRQIESLRAFDPASQRSTGPVQAVELGPARELVLPAGEGALAALSALDLSSCSDEARARFEEELSLLRDGAGFPADYFYVPFLACATLLDHLPAEAAVIVDEEPETAAALDEAEKEAAAVREEAEQRGEIPRGLPLPQQTWRELRAAIAERRTVLRLSRWASDEDEGSLRLPFAPATAYGGQLRRLVGDAVVQLREGRAIALVSQQAHRLAELFEEQGRPATVTERPPGGGLALVQGSLPAGWRLSDGDLDLSLVTDAEVFGFTKQRRRTPKKGISREAFLAELSPGDYVVHIDHGIGRFSGLVRMAVDENEREYLELHYAEGDKLFVPTDQVDRVSRYVGPSEHEPRLTRLGSGDWQRAKRRVRQAVQDMARELLSLYSARELVEGHAFSPDAPWQAELEASFPYIETEDQAAAIAEVKRDMERARPMDRLVSGDVGYGKTEVAIRAAFKTVIDGKQVALLVPTTVLAQQHFQTFRERLAAFPVRVEMLSRFRSDAEQRQVVESLAEGAVDIVIGTHRLLQKDVAFKELGLVIIDEEQRFGVAHKEHLKQMRRDVDVLTLSATPIPRTLYMALGGIRDMSTMETPPEERLPIKTYVSEFDDRLVREAIVRETERGGQVYFVHNRVHNIDMVAGKVRDVVPEASIDIAHGQMNEHELERAMIDFLQGRTDVLVCTTIIESGLDIPNVNTIIINQADKLGLAQLYQLRGRVGRGAHRAYAYLLYDRKGRLTDHAQKRLQTIFEATELGAGFQIALRDLEIRGAGNLLGAEQSGYMAAIGFDLYCRMLADSTERLRAMMRGETPPPPTDGPGVAIELPLTAHLPQPYVPDLNQRLAVYQRLSEVTEPQQVESIGQELIDRFGEPPPPTKSLLFVALLRTLALRAGVQAILTEGDQAVVRLAEGTLVPREAMEARAPRGVQVGRTLLRVALGQGWRGRLRQTLETLGSLEPVLAET